MVTKTTVQKSSVGEKKGWAFAIYYNNASFSNFISALYKTKKETEKQLQRYLDTGKFDTYGNAE